MHLAQLNVGRAVDDLDSPRLAEFMAALDRINALAERAPGFVWRLKSDSGNATDIKITDDPRFIINMSVWETPEQLAHFVWNTVHRRVYAKKASWFEPATEPYFVMWRIAPGHVPTIEEAMARLQHLRRHGPSEQAFGWESLHRAALQAAATPKAAE